MAGDVEPKHVTGAVSAGPSGEVRFVASGEVVFPEAVFCRATLSEHEAASLVRKAVGVRICQVTALRVGTEWPGHRRRGRERR